MMLLVLFLDMGRQPTCPVVGGNRLKPCEIQSERRFSVVMTKENFRGFFPRHSKKGSGNRNITVALGAGLQNSTNQPAGRNQSLLTYGI